MCLNPSVSGSEISRTQIWQWIHSGAKLDDGREVNYSLYRCLLPLELEKIKAYVGEEAYKNGRFEEAINLFDQLVSSNEYVEFLTLPAYQLID